jgi:hypothetical protein
MRLANTPDWRIISLVYCTVALFVSFLINLAVVAVFAKGFFDPVCAVDGYAMVTTLSHRLIDTNICSFSSFHRWMVHVRQLD